MKQTNSQTSPVLIPIIPAITFDCTVNGKPLKATFTHTEKHPINFIHYLSFSDGYASSFLAIEDAEGWLDEKDRNDYTKAVKEDLDAIGMYSGHTALYCFTLNIENKKTKVWVHQRYSNKGEYSVHYGGDYRFTLQKGQGGFDAFSSRKVNDVTPDETVARQVGALLTSLQN